MAQSYVIKVAQITMLQRHNKDLYNYPSKLRALAIRATAQFYGKVFCATFKPPPTYVKVSISKLSITLTTTWHLAAPDLGI